MSQAISNVKFHNSIALPSRRTESDEEHIGHPRPTNKNALHMLQEESFHCISLCRSSSIIDMALSCFPGAVNPFCRQPICVSSCSDQVALASSPSLLYLYSYSHPNFLFTTKFSPHSKALSCMVFHPTIPGLLVTGGAPNSRVNLWFIQRSTVEKRATFQLQRVSQRGRSDSRSEKTSGLLVYPRGRMR